MLRRLAGLSSLLLVAAIGVACSSGNAVRGLPCRTDRDCNGGLCQAGICESAGVPLDEGGTGADDSGVGGGDLFPQDQGSTDGGLGDAGADLPREDTTSDSGNGDPGEGDVSHPDGGSDSGEQNICGGTTPLEGQPGDTCGVCEDGELACDSTEALACHGDSAPNVCGGCGALEAVPGTHCPDCADGLWTCNEGGSLDCLCEAIVADGTCDAPFTLTLGEPEIFSLCDQGDEEDPIAGSLDCGDVNIRGEDVVYQLDLDEAATVTIDLQDDDDLAAIDTIVYLRTDCADDQTQQICSDDVPCDSSVIPGCTGSVQVRQSTLTTDLEAGTYFVVADQFTYNQNGTAFACGQVQLSATAAP